MKLEPLLEPKALLARATAVKKPRIDAGHAARKRRADRSRGLRRFSLHGPSRERLDGRISEGDGARIAVVRAPRA
jgi:hypothetical protein